MTRIAFLPPHPSTTERCVQLTEPYGVFDVFYVRYDEDVDIAKNLVDQGYEIVVSRGGLAQRLRQSGRRLSVVELQVNAIDLVHAIEASKRHGRRMGVIAFNSILLGVEKLGPALGVELTRYVIDNTKAVPAAVDRAFADGVDVIVAGDLATEYAHGKGWPATFVDTGPEAITMAAEEALRVRAALVPEKLKSSLFEAVLHFVRDGIIAVDPDQRITLANERAQELLKRPAAALVGLDIAHVLPGVGMTDVLERGEADIDTVLQIADAKTMCSKVPIVVGERLLGGLITFQETSRIQLAEAKVRRVLYNKGHVARRKFSDIVGASPATASVVAKAKNYAMTNSNILIVGETGTGKEVFAQSIHNASARRDGPFVAVNCAALPAQILESELFGYVAGAFTGAAREGKTGLFELAHGGTIFLDEISEMDTAIQGRLLRVVQERNVMRLGSDRVTAVDVRVIAATNKDLRKLVREGGFRDDLYFRLDVLSLRLPPLRERREDIALLAAAFLGDLRRSGRAPRLDPAALALLTDYAWPGNIRELQNVLERLAASCPDELARPVHVAAVLTGAADWTDPAADMVPEAKEILDALTRAKGNRRVAAKELGVDRTTLWRRMRRLGVGVG